MSAEVEAWRPHHWVKGAPPPDKEAWEAAVQATRRLTDLSGPRPRPGSKQPKGAIDRPGDRLNGA